MRSAWKIQDGAHINFRYKILSLIGQGNFGTVLKARDLQEDMDVAVKIGNREADEDMQNEFYVLQKIHDRQLPGTEMIVKPMDFFRSRGYLTIVYLLPMSSNRVSQQGH